MTRARDLADFNLDGKAVTINESSADLDFRVESDGNANMLVVDGGNNRVGVGTTPDAALHVLDTSLPQTKIAYDSNRYMNIEHATIYNVSGASQSNNLKIASRGYSGGNNIIFATGGTDAAGSSEAERMRVTSDGSFLVGTSSYDGSHFNDSSGGGFAVKSDGKIDTKCDGTVANFNMTASSGGNILYFAHEGTGVGSIGIQTSGFYIDGESGHEGIRFANGAITPRENGSDSDGASDLGATNNRFKDGYFSGILYSTSLRGQNDTDTGIDIGDTGSTPNIITFITGGSEKARISSNVTPKFFVGCTENPSSSVAGSMMSTTDAGSFTSFSSGTGAATHGVFGNANGAVGSIQTSGSSTTYNTSSDRRLKSNIEDAASASDKIDAIQVRQFDWNVDNSHQDYGLIAQELEPIAPLAVTGDADSDEMMAVDYSKLVPMLLKEIQELRSRVATLEAS